MEERYRKCAVQDCCKVFQTQIQVYKVTKNRQKQCLKGNSVQELADYYLCEEHSKDPLLKVSSIQEAGTLATTSGNATPLKRASSAEESPVEAKTAKLTSKQQVSVQPVAAPSSPSAGFAGTLVSVQQKQPVLRTGNAIKFKPGTAIKISTPNKQYTIPFISSNGALNTSGPVRRPTIFIKGPAKKTIRNVTIELIEKSPQLHLGVTSERLNILKTIICSKASIPLVELYITLKKLRLNEDFSLIGEYFEYSEAEVQKIFARTVCKLAKYLKFLIRWPEGKRYYDRHKNLPIAFRSKLSYVQSLIECVETEVQRPSSPTLEMLDCKNFKFILTITPAGIISYISDAYMGNNDDLTIFNACNFRNIIPKYLSLVADPGEALRRQNNAFDSDSTTDSADEAEDMKYPQRAGHRRVTSVSHTMNIVDSQLTSLKVKDFSIPTLRVREPTCRMQIRSLIENLREFKVLQPYSVLEPQVYQYINEMLVVISALTNLQR